MRLAEQASARGIRVDAVYTPNAALVARHELGSDIESALRRAGASRVYSSEQIDAPYASSSRTPDAMVVAPCSLRTLAAVACGLADNLLTRAALNTLRMRRPLILVVRETPIGVADARNMLAAAEAGAVILPASPAFYHRPRTVMDMVDYIVGKILDVLGVEHNLYERWGPI